MRISMMMMMMIWSRNYLTLTEEKIIGPLIQSISSKNIWKIFKCNLVNLWQILWQRSTASKGFRNINLSRFCWLLKRDFGTFCFYVSANLMNILNILSLTNMFANIFVIVSKVHFSQYSPAEYGSLIGWSNQRFLIPF